MRFSAGSSIIFLTYLKTLRRSDRKLFWIVAGCIVLQLVFTFLKLEAVPFFLYGMYSEPLPDTGYSARVHVLVNGRPLDTYPIPMRERYLLETNAVNYEAMKANGGEDPLRSRLEKKFSWWASFAGHSLRAGKIYNQPEAAMRFRDWFKRKCLSAAGLRQGTVRLERVGYHIGRNPLRINAVNHEVVDDL